MLVVAGRQQPLRDLTMRDLPRQLRAGDVLVFNDTRVIPAQLEGYRGEARIGATYTRSLGAGTGQISASLDHFDTNAPIGLSSGTFDQTGFSGTIGLGYEAALANGMTLAGTARLGGLGTGTRTGDVGLTFRWAF